MSAFLRRYRQLQGLPLGRWLFSRAIGFVAPYFATIRPQVRHYDAGECEVRINDRRGVHNHIGTVHAVALCNLAELCGGMTIDSLMPRGLRWIPAGMTVRYLKKARGPITGRCLMSPQDVREGTVQALVEARDGQGELVFDARIDFHVSRTKPATGEVQVA